MSILNDTVFENHLKMSHFQKSRILTLIVLGFYAQKFKFFSSWIQCTLGQKITFYPNSHVKNEKIHILKSHFEQKIAFQKPIFRKNHIFKTSFFTKNHNFKTSFFTKFTISKPNFSQKITLFSISNSSEFIYKKYDFAPVCNVNML